MPDLGAEAARDSLMLAMVGMVILVATAAVVAALVIWIATQGGRR